jgi:type II secretory pathway component PulC
MTGSTKNRVYYAVLVLAVLFGAYNFWPSSETSPTTPDATVAADPEAQQMISPSRAKPVDLAAREEQPWGSNPFRRKATPGGTTATQDIRWILSGIIYSAKAPVAIINNKTLGVGDIIDRARVKGIGKDTVTLEYNGIEFTLTVTKG